MNSFSFLNRLLITMSSAIPFVCPLKCVWSSCPLVLLLVFQLPIIIIIIKLHCFVFLPSEKNQWTLQTIPIFSFLFICSLSTATSKKFNPFCLLSSFYYVFVFAFLLSSSKKYFFLLWILFKYFFLCFLFFFLLLNLENFSDSFLNSVLLPGQLLLFLKVSNSSFFSSLCTFQFLLLSLVFLSESTIFNHTDHPDSLHEDLQFALIYMLVFYTLHIYFTIPWDATRRSLFLG